MKPRLQIDPWWPSTRVQTVSYVSTCIYMCVGVCVHMCVLLHQECFLRIENGCLSCPSNFPLVIDSLEIGEPVSCHSHTSSYTGRVMLVPFQPSFQQATKTLFLNLSSEGILVTTLIILVALFWTPSRFFYSTFSLEDLERNTVEEKKIPRIQTLSFLSFWQFRWGFAYPNLSSWIL